MTILPNRSDQISDCRFFGQVNNFRLPQYIRVGSIGFAQHFSELPQPDGVWVEHEWATGEGNIQFMSPAKPAGKNTKVTRRRSMITATS
jgi:hypothetical protein